MVERIWFTAEQLLESRALLERGSLADLRMALLLLDNAAELLMHRAVNELLEWNSEWERLHDRAKAVMPADTYKAWEATSAYVAVSRKERKVLDREFGAKVTFLVARGEIPDPIGRFLVAMHEYRNEAYHQDRVRKETLRPAVTVLFEVAAGLLAQLKPGVLTYRNAPEERALSERFGLSVYRVGEDLENVRDQLRSGLALEVADLAKDLANHLLSRLQELDESIDFVVSESDSAFTRDELLKRIQLYCTKDILAKSPTDALFLAYTPPRSVHDISRWKAEAEALRANDDKLALFLRFVEIEDELEPVERQVDQVAVEIDKEIQFQIDLAREK